MKHGLFKMCIVLCGLTCALPGGVFAQDWPQWRGAARDGVVPGFEAPDAWPESLTKQWSVTVGLGDASPALVDGKLYVFTRQETEEVILRIDAATGNEDWRHAYSEPTVVSGGARQHPGPRSSPAVAEGKVVTLGVAGILSCVDAATGKLVWRETPFPSAVPQFFTGSSPLITEGLAIAHLGTKGNGALLAYDLESGKEKWRWDGAGPDYGSPVLAEFHGVKQIVTLTENSVAGVALASGKLLWQEPFAAAGRSNNTATPVVIGDTVIYSASGRACNAIKIEKGEAGFSTTKLWSNPGGGTRFSTATLNGGKLFVVTEKGRTLCLDAATGKTLWTGEEQVDRMGFASMLATGPVMAVLGTSGELVTFAASGAGYDELARYKVADSATYAHPVPSGEGVFIKDESNLTLWSGQ